MLLGIETEALQQLGRALGMRRVVARRRVGRHLDQLLQEAHLLVEVRVDPGVERRRSRSWWSFARARLVEEQLEGFDGQLRVVAGDVSSGLWLMPLLPPRTNSIACGITSCSFIASWPAPLGMRYTGRPSDSHRRFPAQLPVRSARRGRGPHGLLECCSAGRAARRCGAVRASTSLDQRVALGVRRRAQVEGELAAAGHDVDRAGGTCEHADRADRIAVAAARRSR